MQPASSTSRNGVNSWFSTEVSQDATHENGKYQAIHQEDDLFRDFFILCLLTGARRSNVQAMRWEEVDLGLRMWRIPDTKSGDPIVAPLVDPAVHILQARLEASDGCPWVFATRSKTGHLVEPKNS